MFYSILKNIQAGVVQRRPHQTQTHTNLHKPPNLLDCMNAFILFYSVPFRSKPFYYVLVCSILFYCALFCSVLFYFIMLYGVWFYSIFFCSRLICSMLFYSVLFYSLCSMLFYSILFRSLPLFLINSILFYHIPVKSCPVEYLRLDCFASNVSSYIIYTFCGRDRCRERELLKQIHTYTHRQRQ